MLLYLSLITIFALVVFLYSFKEDFATPKKRTLRGTLYLILGLSAGVPIIHLIFFANSIGGLTKPVSYLYWAMGGLSYVLGATIYMLRIPEKIFKGTFDIIVHMIL